MCDMCGLLDGASTRGGVAAWRRITHKCGAFSRAACPVSLPYISAAQGGGLGPAGPPLPLRLPATPCRRRPLRRTAGYRAVGPGRAHTSESRGEAQQSGTVNMGGVGWESLDLQAQTQRPGNQHRVAEPAGMRPRLDAWRVLAGPSKGTSAPIQSPQRGGCESMVQNRGSATKWQGGERAGPRQSIMAVCCRQETARTHTKINTV